MVNREIFDRLFETNPEIRKCSQENDCILCRENNKDTVCHLADDILNSEEQGDINSIFNIADAFVDCLDAYCYCKSKCNREFDLFNENDAKEFYNNHSLIAIKNDWELYYCMR